MSDTVRTFINLISVIVAAIGITFGIVKSRDADIIAQVQDFAIKNETRIEMNVEHIQRLQRSQDVIENELQHISKGQEEIKKELEGITQSLKELNEP
jgi:hypothetical protein